MTILLIVESPAKCKKIEGYLRGFMGNNYKCIASFGHIRGLTNGLKSIDIQNGFKPSFSTLSLKHKYINRIKDEIKKCNEVLLATDDDREGEAIAWHICKACNLPVSSTKRIIFHEITKPALEKAVLQPTTINMNTVHAQQARQILDVLVGFKTTPVLWSQIVHNTKSKLSAGRCQTPALRLIYDNQKLIDEHPGEKQYQTTGIFTKKNLPFTLNKNKFSLANSGPTI